MSFSTVILCILVFMAVSALAGWVWFSFCRWNEELVFRNFKPLAVVIPMTFLLALIANHFWLAETKKPDPIPVPLVEEKKEPKPVKKRKPKPKKVEDDEEEEVRIRYAD